MTEELEKKAEARCNVLEIDNCEYKTFGLDGYEQGQKDNDEYILPAIKMKNEIIEELEKSIEELKWEQKQILEDNDNYQKENEELKKKVFVQEEIIIGEQKENKELKAQIEKMKCCENCKFWIDNDCVLEHDYDCKRWNNHNTDDYWELAE